MFECYVPANARMPAPHSHDGFEETIYGLEGVSTWTIDGQTVEIGPGEAVCVARGQIHGFDNRGSVDAKFLALATPGVFGSSYFREIGEVLAASAGGPPDLDGDGRGYAPPRAHAGHAGRYLSATDRVGRGRGAPGRREPPTLAARD